MATRNYNNVISINLCCYVIRFKLKNTPNEDIVKVSDVFGERTFAEKMQLFVNYFELTFQNKEKDRILYLNKVDPDYNNNTLTGLVRKGITGTESYIDELNNDKKGVIAATVGKIGFDQFNSSPFYFHLSQPDHEAKGILFIAQSYKQYGFKELFEEAFKDFTTKINSPFTCYITQLSVPALFDSLIEKGVFKKLVFKKHSLPQNFENSFLQEDGKNTYQVDLSITATRGSFVAFKSKLKSFKDSDTSLMEIFPLDEVEYDNLSADVYLGGKKRVLNMKKPSDFGTYYDVTDEVRLDPETKHPLFSNLKEQSYKIAFSDILPNIQL